ncbi:hypothetical protein lbkm_2479 [Lachnospiraceae bacterium KM106-2]|nr:hypothetical protein lbkm_2479 [Lachnospiraceae bacterium KM106-2]
MGRKKAQEINYAELIGYKNVPILVLDQRWHELFPEEKKTPAIKKLERQLDDLLKQQGKLVNDIKDMKKLKKKLMIEIVDNMNERVDDRETLRQKKQSKSKDLIEEINSKVNNGEDELIQMPFKIKQVNERLLVESMKVCYHDLSHNRKHIDEISVWVEKVRTELKNQLIRKQDMEAVNSSIYSYMHDLLGPEVIDYFDEHIGASDK